MGFLSGLGTISRLDAPLLDAILRRLGAAGLVQSAIPREVLLSDPARLGAILAQANAALEYSPLPDHEWPALRAILGDGMLTRLCGISVASLRRYAAGQRPTPDAVAQRLHLLALVVADLRGAYNDYGVRRWFQRPRAQLEGHTPIDVLPSDWTPESPEALQLRELAAALTGSPAT
jgi:uncharacterized protein (DUF2384 family)